MADIFISWGKPDEARVQSLSEQIRAAGFDVFEYSDDMRAGDNVTGRVIDEINKATIAILCLSDAVVDRDWVRDELAWACQALEAADRFMRAVAPLRVGDLAKEKHPSAIAKFNLYVADLLDPSDLNRGIDRLVRDLCVQLNRRLPLVIPATVIAMDTTRCDELLKDVTSCEAHFTACKALGMTSKADDLDKLRKCYGTNSFELRPFADERTISDHLRRTENWLNEHGVLPTDQSPGGKPNSVHFKLIEPSWLTSSDPALKPIRGPCQSKSA